MSKKKFTKLDVQMGVGEEGIRASLPSAPTANPGFGGNRFRGGGRGGGDRRGGGGSRYESSVADSNDNWRSNRAPPSRSFNREDRGDREAPRERRYPRNDRSDRGDSRIVDRSSFGTGRANVDRDRPRNNGPPRDFGSSQDDSSDWRGQPRKVPQRTKLGSSSNKGWDSADRSSMMGGGRPTSRPSRFGSSSSSSLQSSRPLRPPPSNSKFSGSNKGFGRRGGASDAPPEPRITYTNARVSRTNSRLPRPAKKSQPADEFPTLPKVSAPVSTPATTPQAAQPTASAVQTKQQKANGKKEPPKTQKPKPKKKETARQKSRKLLMSFRAKLNQGQPLSLDELREGFKRQRFNKIKDEFIDSLAASLLNSSRVGLGEVSEAISQQETAPEIMSRLLKYLHTSISASQMADLLEECKVDFENFVAPDSSLKRQYGDVLELVCSNETVRENVINAQSPQDFISIVLECNANDISLPICRRIGNSLAQVLFEDENCLERGNEMANVLTKISAGEMKKSILIGSVIETWHRSGKPAGLSDRLESMIDAEVISFENFQDWQSDTRDQSEAKRDALFPLSDWSFRMDHQRHRAQEEQEEDENESDEDDVGDNEYAGNLLQKPKHKEDFNIIYYE